MDTNNGTSTGVEPDAMGAPGADGKEQLQLGQPEGTQSTGENTLEGGKGTTRPAWMAQLPSDLKDDAELQGFATLGDFVRGMKQQNSDGNKDVDSQSDQETEPVKYEDFAKRLDEENDPFGVVSETLKTSLETLRLPKEDAEKVFDALQQAQTDSVTQLVEKGKDWCEAQLKKTWGKDYAENRRAMTRAYVALVQGDEKLSQLLDNTGASINPAVAELLSRVGKSIAEDGSIPSNLTGGKGRNPRVPVNYPD